MNETKDQRIRRIHEARNERVRRSGESPQPRTGGRRLLSCAYSLLRLTLFVLVLGTMAVAGWFVVERLTSRPQTATSGATATPAPVSSGGLEERLVSFYLGLRSAEISSPAGTDDKAVPFEVRSGDTTTAIGQRLQQAGLVRDAELFRLYVRSQGADGKLEAGEYRLRANMTMGEIVDALRHGLLAAYKVTLREGLRAEETAEALAAAGQVNAADFLAVVKAGQFDYTILKDRPAKSGLEGYLFPDTYEIAASATVTQIADLLVKTLDQRFTPAMRQQAAEQKQTVFQVLIVASLVEREAQLAAERPIVASVYLNRLDKGMALEADSTVQYALGYDYDATGKTWWKRLALEDLRRPVGPYSTYLNVGLPPGPICNPGLASIQAVLQPAKTDYLYYYAKGDGSHAFAKTFEEHQENMRKYGR